MEDEAGDGLVADVKSNEVGLAIHPDDDLTRQLLRSKLPLFWTSGFPFDEAYLISTHTQKEINLWSWIC
jgi:hypothetical protein